MAFSRHTHFTSKCVEKLVYSQQITTRRTCRPCLGLSRHYWTPKRDKQHVAIVGSGPAGFYVAQQILKEHATAKIDMYEKLPVPFGLVRFGVAPDHPEVKNCINQFTNTARNERFSFFGNVDIGTQVRMKDLKLAYHAIVLCHGAQSDRLLDIPGENFPGCYSARGIVAWYNGLPSHADLKPNMDVETAVIVGLGNVALDVARVLLSPLKLLEDTDITDYALEALSKSRIRRVILVGRRSPLHAAFTIKELRELIKLDIYSIRTVLNRDDFLGMDKVLDKLQRPRKRLTELMYKAAMESDGSPLSDHELSWELRFLRSPVRIIPNEARNGITSIVLRKNIMDGDKDVPTEEMEEIKCGMVIRSVGYKCKQIDRSVPFDNTEHHVYNENGKVETGIYCAGWAKHKPSGVIVNTMNEAFNVGKHVANDLKEGHCLEPIHPGSSCTRTILQRKLIPPVSWEQWELIDRYEKEMGKEREKPREKLTDIKRMLQIAQGH